MKIIILKQIILKKIFFLIFLLYYDIEICDRCAIYAKYIKDNIEIFKISNFLKFCSNSHKIIKKFKKRDKPKISIISAIYNREKFLSRLLKNLQYQNFRDIEIIFIDDFSKDNSVKIIKEFQKIDKRVILIRNRENKGTFVARNIGILNSKGKYINIPDPDDILSKDILKISFRMAKKFNYDIIRFNSCNSRGNLDNSKIFNNIQTGPIYQPDLSNYIFYGSKELQIIDMVIFNKFVKREVFIKALNLLEASYLKLYMVFFEDGLINYFVHLVGKSFYFLKKRVGYHHLRTAESITKNKFKYKYPKTKYLFIYLKFVFENSKNTKYSKDKVNHLMSFINENLDAPNIITRANFSEDVNLYKNITNTFLDSSFINRENKNILQIIKEIIKRKS